MSRIESIKQAIMADPHYRTSSRDEDGRSRYLLEG